MAVACEANRPAQVSLFWCLKMSFVRGPPAPRSGQPAATLDPSASSERTCAKPSRAELFALLWSELSDILGTAATAILLRRAVRRALPRRPELAALDITHDTIEHGYTVPAAWSEAGADSAEPLRELGKELSALLVDLTGFVVVRRLAAVKELRESGIFPQQEASP